MFQRASWPYIVNILFRNIELAFIFFFCKFYFVYNKTVIAEFPVYLSSFKVHLFKIFEVRDLF